MKHPDDWNWFQRQYKKVQYSRCDTFDQKVRFWKEVGTLPEVWTEQTNYLFLVEFLQHCEDRFIHGKNNNNFTKPSSRKIIK